MRKVRAQARESREIPRLKAFCRVAPSVLFRLLAIFAARVFCRASPFSALTSAAVHARRFDPFLAIRNPSFLKTIAAPCSCNRGKRKAAMCRLDNCGNAQPGTQLPFSSAVPTLAASACRGQISTHARRSYSLTGGLNAQVIWSNALTDPVH